MRTEQGLGAPRTVPVGPGGSNGLGHVSPPIPVQRLVSRGSVDQPRLSEPGRSGRRDGKPEPAIRLQYRRSTISIYRATRRGRTLRDGRRSVDDDLTTAQPGHLAPQRSGIRTDMALTSPSLIRPPLTGAPPSAYQLRELAALERRALWLSTWLIHNANHLRPSRDGLKVGGHQSSSASVSTLMTALYFHTLAAPGPDRGQAARLAGDARHRIPARPPDPRPAGALPRARRRAVLSFPHQGQDRRRLLHRLGRARGGGDALRLHHPGLCRAARSGGGRAPVQTAA